jgi:hypothetical protein
MKPPDGHFLSLYALSIKGLQRVRLAPRPDPPCKNPTIRSARAFAAVFPAHSQALSPDAPGRAEIQGRGTD